MKQSEFSESTRLEVPAEYAFRFLADPSRPVQAVAAHSLVPDGHACTYTWAMTFRSRGPIGALVGRVFARFMHSNARAQQRQFRAEVERRFRSDHRPGDGDPCR